MKTKKMRLAGIVMLAVTLIVVGVLVWPEPKEARATNCPVRIHVAWNDAEPYAIDGTACLCDNGGIPLPNQNPILLGGDLDGDDFSGQFVDVPSGAAKVLFVWEPNARVDWFVGNPAGTYCNLNWSGETLLETEAFAE